MTEEEKKLIYEELSELRKKVNSLSKKVNSFQPCPDGSEWITAKEVCDILGFPSKEPTRKIKGFEHHLFVIQTSKPKLYMRSEIELLADQLKRGLIYFENSGNQKILRRHGKTS
jgi:hypothetical protein